MITDQQPATVYYTGLDLHKANAVVDVLNASGTSVYHGTIRECKREQIRKLKARFGPGLGIVLESTYNWYWVVDECRRQEIAVQLGHALDIKRQMPGKHKSDPRDARRMAEMARMDTFPEVYAARVSYRATRDLMRRRQALVHEQTRFVLHHQCVADQYLMDEEPLEQAGYAPEVIEDITRSRAVDERMIRLLQDEIARLERDIERRVVIHDEESYQVLRSVPGIGRVLALVLLYEIQDLSRFTRAQQFSSYCRVVNPQCESNGKRAGTGDLRRGNRYLCWALHELVGTSCRHCPTIKAYYARLRRRRSTRHAHRIMAHHWAVAIYFMLKRKEPFDLDKFLGSAYGSAKGSHCADR